MQLNSIPIRSLARASQDDTLLYFKTANYSNPIIFMRDEILMLSHICQRLFTLEWSWKWTVVTGMESIFPLPPSVHWTVLAGCCLSVGDCGPGQIQVFPRLAVPSSCTAEGFGDPFWNTQLFREHVYSPVCSDMTTATCLGRPVLVGIF